MLHSLALEKNHSSGDSRDTGQRGPQRVPDEEFVYMLLPATNGYSVLRAPLDRFLAIAEPVSEIPRNAPSGSVGMVPDIGAAVFDGNHLRDAARAPTRASADGQVMNFGDVEIDAAARVVTRGGCPVPLAPLEFDLLVSLYRRGGAAVSRRELMRELWGEKKGVTSRTVDTHIFNLRRKLENDPARPEHLLTVSKIGYRLQG